MCKIVTHSTAMSYRLKVIEDEGEGAHNTTLVFHKRLGWSGHLNYEGTHYVLTSNQAGWLASSILSIGGAL